VFFPPSWALCLDLGGKVGALLGALGVGLLKSVIGPTYNGREGGRSLSESLVQPSSVSRLQSCPRSILGGSHAEAVFPSAKAPPCFFSVRAPKA